MQSLPRSRFRACISNRGISPGFVFFLFQNSHVCTPKPSTLPFFTPTSCSFIYLLRPWVCRLQKTTFAASKRTIPRNVKVYSPESESTSTLPHAVQAPPTPKDGGMMPRPTNVDSSLPSGPRSQPQIVTSAGCQSYRSPQQHNVPAIRIFGRLNSKISPNF
jgi:hypothetical protein